MPKKQREFKLLCCDLDSANIEIIDDKCPNCGETMLTNSYKDLYVTDNNNRHDDICLHKIYFRVCPKCLKTYVAEL